MDLPLLKKRYHKKFWPDILVIYSRYTNITGHEAIYTKQSSRFDPLPQIHPETSRFPDEVPRVVKRNLLTVSYHRGLMLTSCRIVFPSLFVKLQNIELNIRQNPLQQLYGSLF